MFSHIQTFLLNAFYYIMAANLVLGTMVFIKEMLKKKK
jgi:hypothetical protein